MRPDFLTNPHAHTRTQRVSDDPAVAYAIHRVARDETYWADWLLAVVMIATTVGLIYWGLL